MSYLTKQELDRIRDYTVSDTGLRLLDTIARLEGELASSRADALGWAANECIDSVLACASRIRALIPTNAAARDQRDRRIRLEEHALLCPKCSIFASAESGCKRFIELRAPVPAERAK